MLRRVGAGLLCDVQSCAFAGGRAETSGGQRFHARGGQRVGPRLQPAQRPEQCCWYWTKGAAWAGDFFTAYARGTHPRKCGGSDIHIGGLAHVGVLCAFLGGEAEATRKAVREHVSLTHQDREVFKAADALVQILGAVLAGGGLREAIFEHGSDWLSQRTAEQWSREPDDVVIGQRVSPACYIADAFPASLYLAWKYADDFEGGVIANANVGGDNCHRGAVVGALLGSAAGKGQIPARFCDGLHDAATLRRQVHRLAL